MSPKMLKSIKDGIRKFYILYEVLVERWNDNAPHGNGATYPEVVIVSVILQNMQFDGTNCHGYSHEEAVKGIEDGLKHLEAINEYHNKCYMTHYAFNEVDTIITYAAHQEFDDIQEMADFYAQHKEESIEI